MQVVWFKRDLRIHDNEALSQAARRGAVLPLYILEPELWSQPDMSRRHYLFLEQSLSELAESLAAFGHQLVIKTGNAIEVLSELHQDRRIDALWSHQETWNGWTYERDKRVETWVRSNDIKWNQPRQFGVIRGLKNRNGWAKAWDKQMRSPQLKPPINLKSIIEQSQAMPSPEQLGLSSDGEMHLQIGGRKAGLKCLESFLYERGEHYSRAMSSPLTAYDACSRLSPHLAFGTLSMREVYQAAQTRSAMLATTPIEHRGKWSGAFKSFSGRLHWHCHFMQKLEDEPRLEFENLHPAYDGIRSGQPDPILFDAWKTGKTGYPMVDACMRSLINTGWLNFRMRAMLVSFASYHLWLPWQQTALYLARLFTDYEPGIHYSQVQMQSGTTGINSIRIYNPIKQGLDHDPDGIFVRKWVPELAKLPTEFIHAPWKSPSFAPDYPAPIVDQQSARKHAADQLYGLRKGSGHKDVSNGIVAKHGSRKSGLKRTISRRSRKSDPLQGELPL